MNMKATNWIKAGFCLYIGWGLSRVLTMELDHVLGVHIMDWLKKHWPDLAANVQAEYKRAFTK